jgi:hypothetical protein
MPAVLLLPFLLLAQDKPPEKCTISGTVINYATGEPLDKVEIVTEVAGARGDGGASATSDAHGHFVLPDLEPGQYRLKGKRNRFLDTYYGARRAEGTGIPIVVEAGQNIKDLKFKLMPFGVIAGTIRDAEGEPLVRVAVTAMRVKFEEGRRKVTTVDAAFTDDMGQYRITGLAPGKYYVRADPKPKGPGGIGGDVMFSMESSIIMTTTDIVSDVAPRHQPQVLLPALFPSVQEPQAARTVDLEIGARVMGIDISLPRSATVPVKGHVSVPDGSHAGMVSLSRGEWMGNSLDPRLMAATDEHGDFTFPAVPQGSYILTANATGTPHAIGNVTFRAPGAADGPIVMEGSGANFEGKIHLDVGSTAVEGVHVLVTASAQVTGRVIQAGDKGPVIAGSMEFDDGVSDIRRADLQNGEFNLDLPHGHYNVYLNTDMVPQDSSRLLIRGISWGGRDIASEGLTIAGPGKISLDVVAAPDGGKLDGIVLDKDDKPVGGATVVLIPESKFRSRTDRYFETETDQYGHFDLDGIPPGDYKAFAWDDIEPGIWRDPDFVKSVESKAEPVTLKTAAHETTKLHIL